MRTRELARLISTLGKLPREQRYAVVTELASMQSRAWMVRFKGVATKYLTN